MYEIPHLTLFIRLQTARELRSSKNVNPRESACAAPRSQHRAVMSAAPPYPVNAKHPPHPTPQQEGQGVKVRRRLKKKNVRHFSAVAGHRGALLAPFIIGAQVELPETFIITL